MNRAELVASLRGKIGNPTTADVSDAFLHQCLNDAMRHIMDRYPFYASRNIQTFPTVAGTKRYALPSNLSTLLRVWNATQRHRIHKADMRIYANTEDQVSGVQGDPYHYHRLGTTDSGGTYSDWIQF